MSKDGIDFEYEFDNSLHDRWIETDNGWRIILGRGLDIFQFYTRFPKQREHKGHY